MMRIQTHYLILLSVLLVNIFFVDKFMDKNVRSHKQHITHLNSTIDSLQTVLDAKYALVTPVPDFKKVAETINSKHINKSKLKHLLIYMYALCNEYKVPFELALGVVHVESTWNPVAVSSSGALGLMQIMPATADSEFSTPAKYLTDPYVNVTIGIKYLGKLRGQFSCWNGTLTAYSHGPTITRSYSKSYILDNNYRNKVWAVVPPSVKQLLNS